jgi:hypothetical protein
MLGNNRLAKTCANNEVAMSKSSIANSGLRNSGFASSVAWPRAALAILAGAWLAMAPMRSFAQAAPPTMQDNAPDRYIVEKGDTLWGISGKYLKEPWRWPELWRMNRDQIANPNRIYPGDVLVLDRSKTPPELSRASTVKLSPQVRVGPLQGGMGDQAIPAIPARYIEPYLSQPLVIEEGGLAAAPRIVSAEESRVYLGTGNIAYVTGIAPTGSGAALWNIYRPGKTLIDPDTGKPVGVEAIFLGTARVVRSGEPATIEILTSKQEIGVGDRLVPADAAGITSYVPHAPKVGVHGRIIGLYDGLPTSETGANSIIAINRGKRDGLEQGNVLALLRAGAIVPDPESDKSRDTAPKIQLPDERYGLVFVFRVFEGVSYALVMESSRPVDPADIVQTP